MEEPKNEIPGKKIDESWKEAVDKERDLSERRGGGFPEVTFGLFISGLMMEALIALGEVENPVTKKKEPDAAHARFLIDTLGILKEKTKNNLTKEEEEALDSILYDLRTRYVTSIKG